MIDSRCVNVEIVGQKMANLQGNHVLQINALPFRYRSSDGINVEAWPQQAHVSSLAAG